MSGTFISGEISSEKSVEVGGPLRLAVPILETFHKQSERMLANAAKKINRIK
jgi:hypothetical protein